MQQREALYVEFMAASEAFRRRAAGRQALVEL
jgi:hypothetical protein